MTNGASSRNDNENNIFDIRLKAAAQEALIEEAYSHPSEEELLEAVPSLDSLDEKIRGIVMQQEKEARRKSRRKKIGKFAAIAAVTFLTFSSIALISAEASRIFILNTARNLQYDHMTFGFDDSGEGVLDQGVRHDFVYTGTKVFDTLAISTYQHPEGDQIIIQHLKGVDLNAGMDTDYREFSTIVLGENECTVYFFQSYTGDEHHIVMWYENNTIFQIHADIDINTIFAVVESFLAR